MKTDLIKRCIPVNCRVRDGAVYPALTPVKKSDAPAGVVFAHACDGVVAVCAGGAAYLSGNGGGFHRAAYLPPPYFAVRDTSVGGSRTLIIGGGAALEIKDGAFNAVGFGKGLKCGVMHCGRLFAADADEEEVLRWSSPDGADDFREGLYAAGRARLADGRGKILNMLVFGGKIILVRERGLTVVTAYGLPENFIVENTDTDADGIFADTAQVAGGYLFFMTASGLKRFDGSRITPVYHRCAGDVFSPSCSCALGGLYFAGCRSRALGRAVLCYDAHSEESYLIDAAADAMCADESVHIFNADGGYATEKGEGFRILCAEDFGTPREKTLSALRCSAPFAAEIESGGRRHTFDAPRGALYPHFNGKAFGISLTGSGGVGYATAEAEL